MYTLISSNPDPEETFLKKLDPDTRTCDSEDELGCACDRLLQEFHRYDEDISWHGKWGGGSTTAVCRGWGTSNVSSQRH